MKIIEKTKNSFQKLENSRIKFEIEISKELYEEYKNKVLTKKNQEVSLPGFRKGNAPLDMLESYLGASLIEQVITKLVPEISAEMIIENDFKPMDQLAYSINEVDPTAEKGYVIKFTAEFTNLPEIKLPNFEEIKIVKEEIKKVEEADIDQVVKQYEEKLKSIEEMQKSSPESVQDEADLKIPTREEIAKKLSEQFEHEADQKFKSEVLKTVCEKSTIEFPEKLMPQEIETREKSYTQRIESLGLKLDDFLKMQNTTIENLRGIWEKEARESIQVALVLGQIVREYELNITEQEVEDELKNVGEISTEEERLKVIEYIRNVKFQQKAMDFILNKIGK
jgi:FKBP-type peptidyl-prolyl cis-trans isomerase (trigger factor)